MIILIVEDNIDSMEATVDLFTDLGCLFQGGAQIICAYDGQEGLQKFLAHSPGLVVSDVDMPPGMNGLELTRQIRKVNKNVPIVVCSGWNMNSRDQEVLEAGANAFLQKPFFMDQLLAELTRAHVIET